MTTFNHFLLILFLCFQIPSLAQVSDGICPNNIEYTGEAYYYQFTIPGLDPATQVTWNFGDAFTAVDNYTIDHSYFCVGSCYYHVTATFYDLDCLGDIELSVDISFYYDFIFCPDILHVNLVDCNTYNIAYGAQQEPGTNYIYGDWYVNGDLYLSTTDPNSNLVTFDFPQPGIYDVYVVQDCYGNSAPYELHTTVTIENNCDGICPSEFLFEVTDNVASFSILEMNELTEVLWTISDGSSFIGTNTMTHAFTCDTICNYEVTASFNDPDCGEQTFSQEIQIDMVPIYCPWVIFIAQPSCNQLSLKHVGSHLETTGHAGGDWYVEGELIASITDNSIEEIFYPISEPGLYQVELWYVCNGDTTPTILQHSFVAQEVCDSICPSSIIYQQTGEGTYSFELDNIIPLTAIEWNFSDGTQMDGASVSHTFEPGINTASATFTDPDCGENQIELTIFLDVPECSISIDYLTDWCNNVLIGANSEVNVSLYTWTIDDFFMNDNSAEFSESLSSGAHTVCVEATYPYCNLPLQTCTEIDVPGEMDIQLTATESPTTPGRYTLSFTENFPQSAVDWSSNAGSFLFESNSESIIQFNNSGLYTVCAEIAFESCSIVKCVDINVVIDEVTEKENQPFKLFPNPAQNEFRIIPSTNIPTHYFLYDATGRKLTHGQLTTATSISTENMASGTYIINIQNTELSTTMRLIIAK
jgi:hypothetical protein